MPGSAQTEPGLHTACCSQRAEEGAHAGPHPAATPSVHHRAQPPDQEEGIMVQRGAPGWPCSPRAGGPGCSPLASPATIRHIKSFDPSSCLPFLCPSPWIFQVRGPRRPRAHTDMCPHTQERWAGSGTQQGAASGGRCRAYCSKGTGHARHVRPHLHTWVNTHAALTHKHVYT